MEANKIGILDFFSAFRTDVTHEAKRYDMNDLKSRDWEVVSKEVKEELTMKSQKRIEKIEEAINVLKTKIKNSFMKKQEGNEINSSQEITKSIEKENEGREH